MSVVNYVSVPDVKWKTTCEFLKKPPAGSSFLPAFVLEAWGCDDGLAGGFAVVAQYKLGFSLASHWNGQVRS